MSTKIDYGKIDRITDTISSLQRSLRKADQILSDTKTNASKLPGSDDAGYMASVSALADQKLQDLGTRKQKMNAYKSVLTTLKSDAKSADSSVAGKMDSLTSAYAKDRKWYQKGADWIYETFCVDIPNATKLTRDFMNSLKKAKTKVGEKVNDIKDWFKYGDGKYVLNILTAATAATVSVIAAVSKIGEAVAACGAVVLSGGAATPLAIISVIAAVAATVTAVVTVADSFAVIWDNAKALKKSGKIFDEDDGDPMYARYYGSTSGVSDIVRKRDYGDAKDNNAYRNAGLALDTTGTVFGVVSFGTDVASLGIKKDYRVKVDPTASRDEYSRKLAKQTKGYEFSWKNIKKNLRHEMGWKTSHVVKNKETGKSASVRGPYLNKKEAFNPFSDLTKMKEGRKRSKVVMKNIKTINGNYKNAKNLITGPSKIAEGIKGLSDGKSKDNTVWGNVKKIGEGANDVGGTLPVYDPIGYVTSGIEQLTGIADLLNEYKTTPNYVKETFTAYGY